MLLEIQDLAWDRHRNVAGLNASIAQLTIQIVYLYFFFQNLRMRYRTQMNWCVRRYMKAHSWLIPWDSNLHRIQAARSLYSQTKIWVFLNKKYTLQLSQILIVLSSISDVMVSMLASSAVDCWIDSWSYKTKDYKISIFCFSAIKQATKD